MYVLVVRRRVVDVPRDTIISIGASGSEVTVAGLSPVNGIITQSKIQHRPQRKSNF